MNLEIANVSKRYKGDIWGLKDFSLNVTPGVLGLLGPNGAGKSTLMRIIATITKPTEGAVSWNNTSIAKSPNAVRTIVGYLPQDFGVYPHLNSVEFLHYLAAARGLQKKSASTRIEQLLELVNMSDSRKRPLGSLSGGMKQRVGIAQALLNDPQLLIVDEPTAGLDPEERVRFRNLLAELSGERVVILSSHIVSDIEAAATEIAVIDKGRLVTHCTPEQLLKTVEGKVWEMVISSEDLHAVRQNFIVSGTIRTSEGAKVRVLSGEMPEGNVQQVTASLEDAYLFTLSSDRNNGNR